jgi:hypothetical protein
MEGPLANFVHDALARGIPREDIARVLKTGRWTDKEIGTALDAFVETDLPLPVPRKHISSSPKEAFLFLMLFMTLYTAAVQLGSVLFDLIDLFLPQAGDVTQSSIVSLRYGIASTVVAFPIFLFMCGVIAREKARDPQLGLSPIRRWLTYLTLFVASTSIVVDLIALILRLLEGEVTPRFTLKVLVVAILAGGAFAYYLRDLRRDEVVRLVESGRTRSVRLGVAVLVTAVALVLGVAFWFAGSPMRARLLAQDRQRVQDLATIAKRVEAYYSSQGILPASLDACDINPTTFVEQKVDRFTGRAYVYRVADASHFEVGATFDLPSVIGNPGIQRRGAAKTALENEGFWSHAAGPQAFRIDAAQPRH